MPHVSIIFLGALAAALAVIGSLSGLVEVASLTFLIAFATVNLLAFKTLSFGRWISAAGAAGALLATVLLCMKLARTDPEALAILLTLILLSALLRYFIVRQKD
jgi:hypothetical protein